MYNTLTDKQKLIVDCTEKQIVVKACPGSGKTYSVTARFEKLLNSKPYRHQGIAVLSFTNNACSEIKNYLGKYCAIDSISYPHFIGTIDSFVNSYIFLPYGHLLMNCNRRPEIIGTEYNRWYEFDNSKTKYFKTSVTYRDPNYYFDKVSFNKNEQLLQLLPYDNYHFGKDDWDNQYKSDKSLKKVISDIIESKKIHFSQGKANQADANYFAYKLLTVYPNLAKNLSSRFSTIIVDEAQDTTEIQMAIIDIINSNSLDCMMLIGDPDQAIFEWNTADSSLFMEKYNSSEWHSIDLNENRRSSSKICNLLNNFFGNNMVSIAESKDFTLMPEIVEHDETKQTVHLIKKNFLEECHKNGIIDNDISIVFRGKNFGVQYFDIPDDKIDYDNMPWINGHYHVREIVHGKYLIDNGYLKSGLHLIEKGYHRYMNSNLKYVSKKYIQEQIDLKEYRLYRTELFNFIDKLADTTEKKLSKWIEETMKTLDSDLKIKSSKSEILISELFIEKSYKNYFDYRLDTVHSLKGSTCDAILIFLKKTSSTKQYKNILSLTYKEPDIDKRKRDNEEIRIVYVACSRPRKILWIAVHNGEHKTIWEQKLLKK